MRADLNIKQQLGEAVPTAINAMATGMHMSMAELVKAVSTGTVKAEGALRRMFVVLDMQNRGAALAMMDTIPGKLAQVTSSWEIFKASIGEGAFATSAKRALDDVNKLLNSPQGAEMAIKLGSGLASITDNLVKITSAAIEAGPALLQLAAVYAMLKFSQAAGDKARATLFGTAEKAGMIESIKSMKDAQVTAFREMVLEREQAGRKAFNEQKRLQLEQLQLTKANIEREIAEQRKADQAKVAKMRRDLNAFKRHEEERVAAAIAAEQKIISATKATAEAQRQALQDSMSRLVMGPNNSVRGMIVDGQMQGVDKQAASRLRIEAKEARAEVARLDAQLQTMSVNSTAVTQRVANQTRNTIAMMESGIRTARTAMEGNVLAMTGRLAWYDTQIKVATASSFVFTNAMRAKAAAAAAARMAVNALGVVVSAMGGWVGIAITALAALVTWLTTTKTRAEEAASALDALRRAKETGRATADDVGAVQTERDGLAGKAKSIEDKIKQRQEMIRRLQATPLASAADKPARDNRINQLAQENAKDQQILAGLQKQLVATEGQLKLIKDISKKTLEANGVGFNIEQNNDQINKNLAGLQKAVDNANAQIAKARGRNAKEEELRKLEVQGMQAELKYQVARQNEYNRYINQILAAKSGMSAGAYEAMMKDAVAKRDEASNRIKDVQATIKAPTAADFTNDPKKNGGARPAPPSFFEMDKNMLIKQNIERVAAIELIEESMTGILSYQDAIEKYRAAYASMAERGIFDMKFKRKGADGKEEEYTERPGPAQLNEAADEAALKYKLDSTKKMMTQIKQASDEMWSKYESLRSTDGDDSIRSPIRKFEKLRAALGQAKHMMDESYYNVSMTELQRGEKAAVGVTIESFVKLAEDRAQEISDAMLTPQQRTEEKMRRMKEEWKKTLDDIKSSSGVTAEQVEMAEKAYNSLIQTANKRIDMTPIEQLGQKWMDTVSNMESLTAGWMSSFADSLAESLASGKASFSDLSKAIQKDIIQMTTRMLVFKSLTSAFPSLAPTTTPSPNLTEIRAGMFAKGGAFEAGNLIKAFAKGGAFTNSITTGTNLAPMAMFGEAGPEAILPLAETSQGLGVRALLPSNAASTQAPDVDIVLNVINTSGQQLNAERSAPRFDGKKMILDVVLSAVSSPGSFRDGLRAAMK